MKTPDLIGPFEQLVLAAILALEDQAYGMAIQTKVAELSGRNVRLGAVYMTLERMREKGYITSREGASTPLRGGKPRQCYRLLVFGQRVLDDSVETAKRIADAVDPLWRLKQWKVLRAKI